MLQACEYVEPFQVLVKGFRKYGCPEIGFEELLEKRSLNVETDLQERRLVRVHGSDGVSLDRLISWIILIEIVHEIEVHFQVCFLVARLRSLVYV